MFGVLFLFLCALEEDRDFLLAFERFLYPFVEFTPEAAPLISVVEFIFAELSVEVPVESPMPEVPVESPEVPEIPVESLEVLVEVSIEVSVVELLPFWAVRLGTEQHDALMSAAVLGLV